MTKRAGGYKSPYGLWEVTTEEDVEGRKYKNLGTHEGYVDEIALALADRRGSWSLHFRLVEPVPRPYEPKRSEIVISLDPESGVKTYEQYQEFFKGRNVKLVRSTLYQSVVLQTSEVVKADLVKQAKAKLTQAELEALGIE